MCCLLLSSDLSLNKCFEFEFNKNLLFSKVLLSVAWMGKEGGGGGAFIRDGATNGGNTVVYFSASRKNLDIFFYQGLRF